MFFARESVPDIEVLDTLFRWGEKRGSDGFGLVKISKDGRVSTRLYPKETYSNYSKDVKNYLSKNLKIGDIILAISRALPETESPSSSKNMQPIVNGDLILVHNGAITKRIHDELIQWSKETNEFKFTTNIDSEAILAAYTKFNFNMKQAMEYISGGVASIIIDNKKRKIYLITDFKPLAHCYVRGVGYFIASDNDCLREIVEKLTHSPRDGINLWEYWYSHYLRGQRIKEIDIDSGMTTTISYNPRYITQDWDSSKKEIGKELCVVACSGGLDSSITLAILKLAGYENIIACHFRYGHRGEDAENMAIEKITYKLKISLRKLDIWPLIEEFGKSSMLIDKNRPITTGTIGGLKKLDAWVNGRNMLFLSSMGSLAESEVMKHNYEKVYLLGGFLNLSEAGTYPDNSEYFLQSFLEHSLYGTLVGNRFKPLYCLSNLMKSELFVLIKEFGLEDIYRETISCDRPLIVNGRQCNCSKNGIPACGSGLLSYWASKISGLEDNRNFYEVDDPSYEAYIPEHIKDNFSRKPDIGGIINRILLPKDKLENLKKNLKENK